jgi:hypothetical protein
MTASADEYGVELRYRDLGGDAGMAAFFDGSRHTLGEIEGTRRVRLANGTPALFSPVGCGGSCHPANLWWERDGVTYSIQIVLPYGTRESTQIKTLLETANSAVPVPGGDRTPRAKGSQPRTAPY